MNTKNHHLKILFYFLFVAAFIGCSAQPGEDAEDTVLPSQLATLIASDGQDINFDPAASSSSLEKLITIQNTGRLGASSISVSGMTADFGFKGGSYPGEGGDCSDALGAGSSCTVVVVFTGVMSVSNAANILFSYGDGLSGTKTLTLRLSNGTVTPALLEASIGALDFGQNFIGNSSDLELVLSNTGQMKAESISLSGVNPPFSFKGGTFPGDGGNCTDELDAESNCKVVLSYLPTDASETNINFSINYNDGSTNQSLPNSLRGVGQDLPVPLVLGLSSDSVPTKSKTWNWSCSLDCSFRIAVNTQSTHTFSSEEFKNDTDYTQAGLTGTYYLHVQARDNDLGGLSEVVSVMAVLDNTKPTTPGALSYGSDMTEMEAPTTSWTASTDETDLKGYEIAIGSSEGGQDVLAWTDIGNLLTYRATALSLVPVTSYYSSVRAVDMAGNYSEPSQGGQWMVPGPPEAITNLSAISSSFSSVNLVWSAPTDNGRAITDYRVFFKKSSDSNFEEYDDGENVATSVSVGGLDESTSYDFKVLAYNGASSADSNITSYETMVNEPFFEPDVYKAINIGGAEESAVVAFEDNTLIQKNGSDLITLNAGETHVFPSLINDRLEADRPIFVAGRKGAANQSDQRKGNMVWSYGEWAGKDFYFTASRDKPHLINIYAFEEATIKIYKGATLIEEQTVSGQGNHGFSINDYGGFRIESTGAIVAHMHSDKGGSTVTDPKPLLPESNDILGIPSRDARITTSEGTASFAGILSDGTSNNYNVNSGSELKINGVGPGDRGQEYQAEALRIISDKPMVANSHADANGYCSAPFIPVSRLKKKYAINVDSKWVAFASVLGGDITVTLPDGTTSTVPLERSVDGDNIPFKARLTNLPGGTRFEASVPFAAWYQPNTNTGAAINDETILFGY